MRAILVAGFAMVLCGGAPAAAQETLKPFEFKQLNTSLTLAQAQASGLIMRCLPAVSNALTIASCVPDLKFWDGGVAGYEHYGLRISFDEAGLVMLDTMILPAGLSTVTAAFEAKYGKPCAAAEEKIQNKFGAVFDQASIIWCFSDGNLKLSRYSTEDMERSSIVFVSKRFADRKPPAPNVNF